MILENESDPMTRAAMNYVDQVVTKWTATGRPRGKLATVLAQAGAGILLADLGQEEAVKTLRQLADGMEKAELHEFRAQ